MSQTAIPGFTPKKRIVKPLPPIEFLRECFEYDSKTGILTWKERPIHHFPCIGQWKAWNTQRRGNPAGSFRSELGGKHISSVVGFWGRGVFQIGRIACALSGVDVPDGYLVDHFNGDPWDNKLSNLRPATHQRNVFNGGERRNKKSCLPLGVARWTRGRFQAYINFNRKRYRLGEHDTVEEAVAARKAGELKYHKEHSRAHRD